MLGRLSECEQIHFTCAYARVYAPFVLQFSLLLYFGFGIKIWKTNELSGNPRGSHTTPHIHIGKCEVLDYSMHIWIFIFTSSNRNFCVFIWSTEYQFHYSNRTNYTHVSARFSSNIDLGFWLGGSLFIWMYYCRCYRTILFSIPHRKTGMDLNEYAQPRPIKLLYAWLIISFINYMFYWWLSHKSRGRVIGRGDGRTRSSIN